MSGVLLIAAVSIMGAAGSIFFTKRFWKFDVIATSIVIAILAYISHDTWMAITLLGMLAGLGAVVVGKIRTDHFKVAAK